MHYCVWFFISLAILLLDAVWAGGAILGSFKAKKKDQEKVEEAEED